MDRHLRSFTSVSETEVGLAFDRSLFVGGGDLLVLPKGWLGHRATTPSG